VRALSARDSPRTPLRQRFLHDLQRRHYVPRTLSGYVAAVAPFAAPCRRCPDLLGAEHTRLSPLHLLQQKASWSRFHQAVAALRFVDAAPLQRPDVVVLLPDGNKPRALPWVLSTAAVARLFAAVSKPRDRLLRQTASAAGLRVGALVHLRVGDRDAQRRVVPIRCAKGRKDRLVPLSVVLRQRQRDYGRR
jgi:site-specific recombinase XerD